jgi:uncharacterized protein
MASPTQNFTERLYHGAGDPLPLGLSVAGYCLAIATMLAVALVIGAGRTEAAIAEVIGLGLIPLAVARLHRVPWTHLGLCRPRAIAMLGALLCGTGIWLLALTAAAPIIALSHREHAVTELSTEMFGGRPNLIALLVTLVAIPALCEELTHRGLLQAGLTPRLGRAGAIAITGIGFAVLHIEPARMVATLLLGVVAGMIAAWSKSLWPAVVLHATNNFVVTVIGLDLAPQATAPLDQHPGWALAAAVLATSAGLAAIYWSSRSPAPPLGSARDSDTVPG